MEAALESLPKLKAAEGQITSAAFSLRLVVAMIISTVNWNL